MATNAAHVDLYNHAGAGSFGRLPDRSPLGLVLSWAARGLGHSGVSGVVLGWRRGDVFLADEDDHNQR